MNRIGLKINGIWCVLPQDVSISIEEQNPLFSDSGSFSYPIEMSVSQNRELFKSIDAVAGRTRPHHLDGLPFELWYDGVMLLYGSIETDDDLDVEEDRCTVNLVSGNGDFQSKIEGLQCTDVPLLDELYIGDVYTGAKFYGGEEGDKFDQKWYEVFFNEFCNMDFKNSNVSDPYPVKPYCNIRVCVKKKEAVSNVWDSPYEVFEADRPWSGVCFYVGYFLKCLFYHLGYHVTEDHFGDVADMNRLAFVTTKCEHRRGAMQKITAKGIKAGKHVDLKIDESDDAYVTDCYIYKYPLYATEKNFPDTAVSDVVESLFSAFGLKIISSPYNAELAVVYVRDVLRDNEVIDAPMQVRNLQVAHTKLRGVRMTYGGDESDTAFNYNDWNAVTVTDEDYKKFISNISPYDKTLYVSTKTGNKYRVKIDGDAENKGDEKNLNPSLFEVAQFNDFVLGEDHEDSEELSIGFTPLIENDVAFGLQRKFSDERTQCLALYVDGAEANKPGYVYTRLAGGSHGFAGWGDWELKIKEYRHMNFADSEDTNPLLQHDCGFMLGVMRGPGSQAGYAIQLENYDGNGNSAWVTVEDEYAFTADTIDAYGNHYDYNGTADGGVVDLANSISLKTHITTAQELGLKDEQGNPIDWNINSEAAKRGLADRFMSEYMYFLLNRKTVKMDVDTTLSHLTSLTWLKRHRIGEVVGFIKSRSYTLSNSGVSDMNIEMYTVN